MPPESRRKVPLSTLGALIEPARIEALLARWIADANECAFVTRCIVDIGPAHHRAANYVLLRLLAQILEQLTDKSNRHDEAESVAVPIRLPTPGALATDEKVYPLRMSLAPLKRLAQGNPQRLAAMIDCLLDGPPQHALANAAMVNVLGLLLEQLESGEQ